MTLCPGTWVMFRGEDGVAGFCKGQHWSTQTHYLVRASNAFPGESVRYFSPMSSDRESGVGQPVGSGVSRRSVAGTVAWTMPVIAAGVAVPRAVASGPQSVTYTTSQVVTIPSARSITVTVNGASGGSSGSSRGGTQAGGAAGGAGGQVIWRYSDPSGVAVAVNISIGSGGAKGNYSATRQVAAAAGGAGFSAGGDGSIPGASGSRYIGGGGGGGSTAVTISSPIGLQLVAAGGGGGSGEFGLGGAGGNASGATGKISPGITGTNGNGGASNGIGGGRAGNVGTPNYTTNGGKGKNATAPTLAANIFGGGGGGAGVVGGLGGQPTGTTASGAVSAGGGGGESGGNVPAGSLTFGTGPLGTTGAAGTQGSVTIAYTPA